MAGMGGARVTRLVIAVGTVLTVLGLAFAVVFNPLFLHADLDASGSASILGLDVRTTHEVSDRTIGEMLAGPATFAFSATPGGPPFYDAAEASHLRDARTVLYGFLALVALGAVMLVAALAPRRRDPWAWHAVQGGAVVLAAAFVAIGLFMALAFDTAFTLFHEVFFPQGNWEFSSATERMVQLYPTPFWELTGMVLAVATLVLCGVAWLLATSRARSLERGITQAVPAAGVPRGRPVPSGSSAGQSPETHR